MIPAKVGEDIRKQWPHATIVDGLDILLRMRRIKTPAEIAVIRKLADATSVGMNAGLAAVKAGATESEVAAAVHAGCVAAGAERMVYGCLASAGPRSFMKNIFPRPDKAILQDELVVIDIGAKLGGYQSDMSRNAVAGRPTDEVRRLLEACVEAEEVGLEATRPGVPVVSVVTAMKEVIAGHGFAEWDWTTGHGFGLDLVEEPHFYPTNTALLEPDMCFYIEPMIVPTSVGTVCFEDMVLVTEGGGEQLTSSPKRVWD
jgi:Xaa-Pro aminopeptidase/Xaa-Pro dipeptidase